MTTSKKRTQNENLQVDWVLSNLRWLLLLSVALVSFLNIFLNYEGYFDIASTFPQIILLATAAIYNLLVMLLLTYAVFPKAIPVITLIADTLLTIGFVVTSGGLTSPLLFFTLFPILTAALRFHWAVSPLVALVTVTIGGVASYLTAPPEELEASLFTFLARSIILLLAALVSGLIGAQVRRTILNARRAEEERELRKLRAAQERSRALFELASTLSATLNYNRVLEEMLEVGETGMLQLGRPNAAHVSMVILVQERDMRIVASRHLPPRDQKTVFYAKEGLLAQALEEAGPVISDNPAQDPELGQLIMMHSCRQAIVMPLRVGFEHYGFVVFGSTKPNTYTEDHKDLLIAICNQAVIGIQNSLLYEDLRRENERIAKLEEDARKMVARELHDGPTQDIAAITMKLDYVRMLLEKRQDIPAAIEELANLERFARRVTKEIRGILFTLRPLPLESQGLRAALEQHLHKLSEMNKQTSYHLEAEEGVDGALNKHEQGIIFYIIEEAVGNSRKYAHAKNLWVRLYIEDGNFVAEVEDDGKGFDVNAVQSRYDERGSLGMINMLERAQLLNGQLVVASEPGQGTTVTLTMPLRGRLK